MKMKVFVQTKKQRQTARVMLLGFTFALIYFTAYALGRTGSLGLDPFFSIITLTTGMMGGMMFSDGLVTEISVLELSDDETEHPTEVARLRMGIDMINMGYEYTFSEVKEPKEKKKKKKKRES